ncbi:translesion error-prone DNA polymerase V autoproteolytic subunit [Candidatus Kaiserbacteria bacterium]|uniref:Translesion error-prone DNA polymerase V autoproteolytic subunit n=1 Tax=candidate division WWE3 bacterium TaxID=2053526 RepID=A0A955LW43_UNCKA|nr:translesion error-prone DNA polymerase V autoproteolytic subunit [Candidatus Kaiserbacteria bacterium]MCA9397593.1 translesion error-prone DNA polymerase V autoproteolytic subunit [candidate division WWE3 bacterium]
MKNEILKVSSISPPRQDDNTTQTPLYASQPAAGFPAPGDDLVEQPLNINDLLVKNESSTFFVRVSGDSMEGARIFDGDVLVVDRAVEPKDGLIVVAAIYGELVVKRLKQQADRLLLVSENSKYQPIVVNDVEGCYVWGVVVGSARVFK